MYSVARRDMILAKPFAMERLLEAVARGLQSKPKVQTPPAEEKPSE